MIGLFLFFLTLGSNWPAGNVLPHLPNLLPHYLHLCHDRNPFCQRQPLHPCHLLSPGFNCRVILVLGNIYFFSLHKWHLTRLLFIRPEHCIVLSLCRISCLMQKYKLKTNQTYHEIVSMSQSHCVLLLNFAHIVGFVKVVRWISLSCYMNFSWLLHGFV